MKLEQLERLCSEIPPAAPWLPILVIHIRPQVKTRQSQSYKLKKNCQKFKFWNFARNCTCDTLSEVVWYDVQIWNGSNQNCRRYRADTGCRTDAGRMQDGRTDGQTKWNQYTPQQLCCAGGIMRKTSQSIPVTPNGLHFNQKYTHTGNPNKAALPFQTHKCVVESVKKCMAEWMNEWRMSEGVIGCVIEWVGEGMIERAEE